MPKQILTKIGIGLLAAALLVVAAFGIQRIIRSKSSGLTAAIYMEGTSSAQTPNSPAMADLPDYLIPEGTYINGIPRLVSIDTTIPNRPTVDVTTYEVKPGDNLFLIAEKYGLRPETVLWGNYEVLRDNPQFLSPGQELNILPTDGVYYQAVEGDNLKFHSQLLPGRARRNPRLPGEPASHGLD